MKALIIFKGKYGATRQYAQWLQEVLSIPMRPPEEIAVENLNEFDSVLIGSSVYIGKLMIRDWLRQNCKYLENKKLFFFVVCGTPDIDEVSKERLLTDNIPAKLRVDSQVFLLPGRVIRKQLGWKDRLMLEIGARLEKDAAKRKTMLQDKDNVNKEAIRDMVTAVTRFKTSGNEKLTSHEFTS